MKLDRDIIRGLVSDLVKQAGYTMKDLEEYLLTTKEAGEMTKMAESFEKLGFLGASDVLTGLKALVSIPSSAAVATGAALGLGGYGAYRALQDSDERVKSKQEISDKYRNANEELLSAKQLQPQH